MYLFMPLNNWQIYTSSVVTHDWNPGTWEAEAGGLLICMQRDSLPLNKGSKEGRQEFFLIVLKAGISRLRQWYLGSGKTETVKEG